MDIRKILKYKKFIENGDHDNGFIGQLSDIYSEQEDNSISPYEIIINSSRANTIYKNGIPYSCVIDYGRSFNKSDMSRPIFYKDLITRHTDGFNSGDIVEVIDNFDGNEIKETYLLIKTELIRGGFDQSIMSKCHGILRWTDQYGEIVETPFAYRSEATLTYGIEDGRILSLGNEKRNILVSSNEHTLSFIKEKRFLFDNRAWKIVAIDTIEFDNVIHIVLEEDQINPATDNLELMVADYYKTTSNYMIEITNGNNITAEVGSNLQLNVIIKKDENIIEEELNYWSSNEEVAVVNEGGLVTFISEGNVLITVSLKNNNKISNSISVNVQNSITDDFTIIIEGSNEIKYGQTKQFKAIVVNNGTETSKEVVFGLFEDDMTSTTKLASITEQSNNLCKIKNNNSNSGYVQLCAILVDDPTIFEWKRIQMKPLF